MARAEEPSLSATVRSSRVIAAVVRPADWYEPARLPRAVSVCGCSGPSSRSQSASTRSWRAIASAVRPVDQCWNAADQHETPEDGSTQRSRRGVAEGPCPSPGPDVYWQGSGNTGRDRVHHREGHMAAEENKAAARRFFEEVWNQGDVSKAAAFLTADFVSHNNLGVTVLGPADYGQAVAAYRRAFPDLHVTIEDVLGEGDRVAVRGTDRGTHSGEYMGFPPTGRQITTTWIEIFRIEGDRAAEGWLETDVKRLQDQLGGVHPA
jgi:steroid delta-isomerase-like uncharacterized protein